MQLRNNYIVNKAFKTFLFASILTGVAQQFRVMADGIVVSNMVDPSALSAINLYYPLETLFYAIISMIVSGAGIKAAVETGKQNHHKASEYFSLALFATTPVITILVALCYAFFPQVINLLSDPNEPTLYAFTADYTKVMLLSFILLVPNYTLRVFINIDGQPKLVTISIIISLILNVILDFFLVVIFEAGIAGAAIATLASDFIGMLFLLPYILKGRSSIKFTMPKKILSLISGSLKQGIPMSISSLLLAILIFILNQLVLDIQGTNGAYIFAIMMQVAVFGAMLLEGISDLDSSIGGVLLGERDYSGFKTLIHRSGQAVFIFASVLTLTMLIYPEGVMKFFGDDGNTLVSQNISTLRIVSIFFIPYLLFTFNTNIHILVEREMFSTLFLILQFVSMISFPWFFGKYLYNHFWWSFPLQAILLLLAQAAAAFAIQHKNRQLSKICLMPLLPDDVGVNFSVGYSEKSVKENLEKIFKFLSICELSKESENRILLCCEELSYNILEHSKDKGDGNRFDIRLTDHEDIIEVRIKDAGMPFNPVKKFDNSAAEAYVDNEHVSLGLRLVNQMCNDISHKFMFGLNVTTLKFKTREV